MKNIKKLLIILVVLALAGSTYYLTTSMPVKENLLTSEEIHSYDYTETGSYLFFPAKNNDTKIGVIIYQGAKVQPMNYGRIAHLLQERNINVYISKMPFTWSFLNKGLAGDIIKENKEIDSWYLGGHSLGGAMISNYHFTHDNSKVKGLFFMGSYPSNSFSDVDLPMLYIFGELDGLVTDKKQAAAISKISSSDYSEIQYIRGGNHAGFGNYGRQGKDNIAPISNAEQQIETATYIMKWITTVELN